MELRNPLTTPRADARYVPKAFTRQDGFDNATDRYDLGAAASYRAFVVEYVLELPVSNRTHVGVITVTHTGLTATIAEHTYRFPDTQLEIETLVWTAGITAGVVQLVLQKTGVGENPTLHYRVHPVEVA